MSDAWFDALWIGLFVGIVIGYLMARKTRKDIKQVIADRRVEEELEAIVIEKQIRDGEALENEE